MTKSSFLLKRLLRYGFSRPRTVRVFNGVDEASVEEAIEEPIVVLAGASSSAMMSVSSISANTALCWVHCERLVHKLGAFTEENRTVQATVRDLIWTFYRDRNAGGHPVSGPTPSDGEREDQSGCLFQHPRSQERRLRAGGPISPLHLVNLRVPLMPTRYFERAARASPCH